MKFLRRKMFKKIVCCLLVLMFAENAFAIEVMSIGPYGGQPPAAQSPSYAGQSPAGLASSGQVNPGFIPPGQPYFNQPFGQESAGQGYWGRPYQGQAPHGRIPTVAEPLSPIEEFFAGLGIQNSPAIKNSTGILNSPVLRQNSQALRQILMQRPPVLRQFGYDLFNQPVTTFAPGNEIPVSPDYIIGPGDEIRIDIWGKVNGSWLLTVNRDGEINIPGVGAIGVTGLTFTQLKSVLRKKLDEYYKGFQMNVSMGSLKSMRIYIVGNARRPGAYTVSSLSTLVSALFDCGGPSKNGSMRAIQLKRNGKTITRLDLYDFLLKGDKSNDVRLMPGDVIFIPPIGPVAAVEGNVEKPAIYELKGPVKISALLSMAGGITPGGYLKEVQLERVRDHERTTVMNTNFEDLTPKKDILVKDGDLLSVRSINNVLPIVRIAGAVYMPGSYAFAPDMRVSDLVHMALGLRRFAFTDNAELTRVDITDKGPRIVRIPINLNKALAGNPANDVTLREDDYLFVKSVPDWRLYRTVTIKGDVRFPGTYAIKKDEKLSALLARAGGFTKDAYLSGAVFTRKSVQKMQQESLKQMVQRLQTEMAASQANKASSALSQQELSAQKNAMAEQQQFIASLKQLKATGRMVIALSPDLNTFKDSMYDIELKNGDKLDIPSRNSVVNVAGAVMSGTTSLVYSKGLNAHDYIKLAGGYSEYADKGRTYVIEANGSARRLSGSSLSWDPSEHEWKDGSSVIIMPGDTIIVPEKLQQVSWLQGVKDITTVLMNIAVTAGVVAVLHP